MARPKARKIVRHAEEASAREELRRNVSFAVDTSSSPHPRHSQIRARYIPFSIAYSSSSPYCPPLLYSYCLRYCLSTPSSSSVEPISASLSSSYFVTKSSLPHSSPPYCVSSRHGHFTIHNKVNLSPSKRNFLIFIDVHNEQSLSECFHLFLFVKARPSSSPSDRSCFNACCSADYFW